MRAILDIVFTGICDRYYIHSNITDEEIVEAHQRYWFPGTITPFDSLVSTLSHSYLYSHLKEAIYSLDPRITVLFHDPLLFEREEATKADVVAIHHDVCEQILERARPLYLELYGRCNMEYRGGHPKIEHEMQLLQEDEKDEI